MGRAEDILEQICPFKDLEPGEERIQWPKGCCTLFNVCITLNRECRMNNLVFVEAEIQSLIYENSSENDVSIYTDGSVVCHVQSSWVLTAQVGGRTVHKDRGAFRHTTSSMNVEVMAVTTALFWLQTGFHKFLCSQ
jgi:hypothetical protein